MHYCVYAFYVGPIVTVAKTIHQLLHVRLSFAMFQPKKQRTQMAQLTHTSGRSFATLEAGDMSYLPLLTFWYSIFAVVWGLTLTLLMSYIYGAPSKARNLTSYIYGRDFLLGILLLEPCISLNYA
jgi:hypothetical protein